MPEKKDKRVKITVVEDDDNTPKVEDEVKEDNTPTETDETQPEATSEPIEKDTTEVETQEETPAEAIEEELQKEEMAAETVAQKPEGTGVQTQDEDEPVISSPKEKIPFWILFLSFLIGLSLGAGLIGGIFFYKSRVEGMDITKSTPSPDSAIQETAIETSVPSSSPTVKTDLSKLNIQILNGSGIAGEAGRVDELLKKAGFTKTTTGNASSYNFTETVVSVKKDTPDDVYSAIQKALSTYVLEKNEDLTASSTYSIVITVGKDKSSN